MSYSTFRQAKGFIESGYGTCDADKLARAVNTIRRHFFNWYQEVSLFLDAVQCFRVHTFYSECNACVGGYQGVTLPRDCQTVEAMWWNDWPVKMQSSWREFQVGISPECDCRLQKFDLPGLFSTAVDLHPARPQKVCLKALDEADIGKKIIIRGTASTGQPVTQEFQLSTVLQMTDWPMMSIDRMGGVIKDVTAGRVLLAAEDGTLLAIYEPDETVPGYRRIKITGLQGGCEVVNIRCARRFFPLTDDDDVVETDNAPAWDSMARYLRLYEQAAKTRDTLTVEKDHYATAMKMMIGDKAREAGHATAASVVMVTPSFGAGGRLHGRARRW
jgi:hypothetical protein